MTSYEVVQTAGIKAVLEDPVMVPPQRPGNGSTLELRSLMARFSDQSDHPRRRVEIIAAIELVDGEHAVRAVQNEVRIRRHSGEALIGETSKAAPVVGVAVGLGMIDGSDRASVARLIEDVERIVEVIGRGADPSVESDAAAVRLLGSAREVVVSSELTVDPVAVVSILYQTMDATAALIHELDKARRNGSKRAPAIERTVRVAACATSLGGEVVASGEEVVLLIGAAGLEFGHGPHACPGRALAERLAEAVLAAASTE